MPKKELNQKTLLEDIFSIIRKSGREYGIRKKMIIKKLMLKGYTKQMLKRGISTFSLLNAVEENDLFHID